MRADPDLLSDLITGVRTIFGGGPLPPGKDPEGDQFFGLLWSYWIEETAADVYAVLNVGPSHVLSLASLMAAKSNNPPALEMTSLSRGDQEALEEHPIEILRLYVAQGAIESLINLSADRREKYVSDIDRLADHCCIGRKEIALRGWIEIDRDRWVFIDKKFNNLKDAIAPSARRVGSYIATTRLPSFANRSIQDIETWCEADEVIAEQIRDRLLKNCGVENIGDDAQLLAGTTLALFDKPEMAEAINKKLVDALEMSARRDPILGFGSPHEFWSGVPPLLARPPT